MSKEALQPISVKPPSKNLLLFFVRCFVDLQLGTITKYLRPAMEDLRGGVIDIGAGESPWREWLPSNCKYYGLDVSSSNEFGMSEQDNNIHLYDGGIMPFADASFDSAICIEVLEHAENPDQLIAEIARILKDRSLLLLTVPWSARRHHIPHDYHRFTRERLSQLFQQHGFVEVEILERGNDISAIANKLIVLTIRLLRPNRLSKVIWTLPLAFFVAPMAGVMLFTAHISMLLGLGSKEDPLGYFVKATRSER
jgi:SAM-dependent methyltransferase